MKPRTAAWLAWSIWAVSLLLLVASGFFQGQSGSGPSQEENGPPGADIVLLLAILCLFTVGAVVASRRYTNPIGWLLSLFGLVLSVGGFAGAYAAVALSDTPNPSPWGAMMAWLSNWAQGPSMYSALILIVLLFPDGKPVTPRWRLVIWLTIATGVLLLFIDMFSPGPFTRNFSHVTNPLGIGALKGLWDLVGIPVFLFEVLLLLLSAASLVLRFRRSRGDERQQLKWFASAGVLVAVIFASGPIFWTAGSIGEVLWPLLFAVALIAIPVSVGIAILRYRLYDIDIIIRRTLIYAMLTVTLALLYFGSVVVLESLLRPVTGQEHNDIVIVASTLIIAALFNPLRTRIQAFIDRRFYRRKYDVAHTLSAFAQTARHEVELDQLANRLVEVVEETMQPSHASLWLKRL